MNDANVPNDATAQARNSAASNPHVTGYCQNCGRPVTAETIRVVGQATYCEPCLEARVAGTGGYAPVDAGVPPVWGVPPAGPYVPVNPSAPNPGLATLLGFIPGVGAMYNGQYPKGIVHLIVFVLLISLANVNGVFGIFIAGWEFYMAFDAYHTARAKRDGLPLPNPFGLNDIGERLGFGKAWPGGADVAGAVRETAQTVTQGFSNTVPPPPYSAGSYGAQAGPQQAPYQQASYQQAPYQQPYGDAGFPPYTNQPYAPVGSGPGPGQGQGPGPGSGSPVVPPVAVNPRRVPAGAVWLIGLGCLFLLLTSGRFDGVNGEALLGLGLIGLGAWSFVRRMTETGLGMGSDGTPLYRVRVFRALRGGVWLGLIGVWFLLDSFNILSFHRSWPLFLILAGVMTLLERLVFNSGYAPAPPLPYGAGPNGTDPYQSPYQPPYDQRVTTIVPTQVAPQPTSSTQSTSDFEKGR